MKKAFKKPAALMLGLTVALSAAGTTAFAADNASPSPSFLWLQIDNYNLGIDDAVQHLDSAPFQVDGVTYVPLRLLGEQSGATVDYDGKDTIRVTHGLDTMDLWVGKKTINFNGSSMDISGSVFIKDGRIVVPVRDIGQLMGWAIWYDSTDNSFSLNK